MNSPAQEQISSLDAIVNSIENDGHVYNWFAFMVTRPEVRSRFQSRDEIQRLYRRLQKATFWQNLIYIIFFCIGLWIILFKQIHVAWIAILVLYPFWKLYQEKTACVKNISHHILSEDFEPEELFQKTLYQVCEIYSRKLDIPSLVDAIYAIDKTSRKTILFIIVFVCFVYPLGVLRGGLLLFLIYRTVFTVANMPFIYKRLK